MSLLQTVTQSARQTAPEPIKELTGFRAGATVRLKEGAGSPRDNTRIKSMLTTIAGAVLLDEPLDGSKLWNVQDLELMSAEGIFEAAKPVAAEDSIYVVFVPANVYTGRYHSYAVAQVKVLASSKDEATEIVNRNQDDVLRFLATRRVQPSGRPLIPAKEPAKKNVFFKDSYYIKELPARSSNDVLTRHGGFKAVRLEKMNEAYNTKATINEAAGYLYTLLKNTKEGRRADWQQPKSDSPALVEFSCRHYGEWEVPEGEEDDGDYDWETPTPFTIKQINDTIKVAGQRYPDFKVDISVEEKNWIDFKVTPRS